MRIVINIANNVPKKKMALFEKVSFAKVQKNLTFAKNILKNYVR